MLAQRFRPSIHIPHPDIFTPLSRTLTPPNAALCVSVSVSIYVSLSLSLKVIRIYNAKLEDRNRRKRFAIDRGLVNVKKLTQVSGWLPGCLATWLYIIAPAPSSSSCVPLLFLHLLLR